MKELDVTTVQAHHHRYPEALVSDLDDLVYRRFRNETNISQSFSSQDSQRLKAIVAELWQVPRPRPGEVLVGSELREIIGKGAFGTVWKAVHLESGQLRAIKVFDSDRLGEGLAVHLFRRGVDAMLHLKNELQKEPAPPCTRHIVQIREVEPSKLIFAMDLIPGKDLSHGYIRGKTLEDKLRLFKKIARAVQFGHTREDAVVHRDIKPQNIVMDGDEPVLTDFDISDTSFAKTLSRRAVGGAFAYAAPEQLSGECEHLEFRSDVYSLGRLLQFFLLEKEPSPLIEKAPVLSELQKAPEGIVKIIRKCTYRELPDRYPNVEALLLDLDKYQAPNEVGAFGTDPLQAQKYWTQAIQLAHQRSFPQALHAGEQAMAYMGSTDPTLSERWRRQMLGWQLQQGQLHHLPRYLYFWFQELSSLRVVFLVSMGFVSVLLLYWRPTPSETIKVQKEIQKILGDDTEKQLTFWSTLPYLSEHPQRKKVAQKRFVRLLFTLNSYQACQALRALYQLTPKQTKHTLFAESYKRHDVGRLIRQYRRKGMDTISFKCPKQTKLSWVHLRKLRIVSTETPSLELPLFEGESLKINGWKALGLRMDYGNIQRSNFLRVNWSNSSLRFIRLYKCDLSVVSFVGSELRMADFTGSSLQSVDFSFADLRYANWKQVRMGTQLRFRGTLFTSNILKVFPHWPESNKFRNAVCFNQLVTRYGRPERCQRWHRYPAEDVFWKKPKPKQPPPGCPKKLAGPIITFPKGELAQDGVCPWQTPKTELSKQKRDTSIPLNPTSRISTSMPSPKR